MPSYCPIGKNWNAFAAILEPIFTTHYTQVFYFTNYVYCKSFISVNVETRWEEGGGRKNEEGRNKESRKIIKLGKGGMNGYERGGMNG